MTKEYVGYKKDQILRLWKEGEGMSKSQIRKKTGCSRSFISKTIRKAGVDDR